ncbi:sporulation protein [Myxococcus sp. RHSTA-1-4]|uniref:sporulation protein n=1 Tax=Myxococcus sp. RHSTA-1-4 TaxID=2874601 RepID=UPI001CBB69A5|nr:sporulation protein [Myxococcus sp. RHSTA-1-4]MBZ4416570.1 sporulation protein [Myxococcus sp. RHSTA-1-4]
MGLLDKLKGAAHSVSGGAARVSLEYEPSVALPGDVLSVRVTATSTGAPVKSGGVFVDLRAVETVRLPTSLSSGTSQRVGDTSHVSFEQQVPIAPAFTLAPNETKVFEGQVRLPTNVQPSFQGYYAHHEWSTRGRIEMTGNDPDSGFMALRVGTKG